jgi:hypothetical protein
MPRKSQGSAGSNPKRSPRRRARADSGVQPSAIREPTVEEIRIRAYEIYCARGGQPGRELDDWLEAERQLRAGL